MKPKNPENRPTLREAFGRFNFRLAMTLAALIIVFLAIFRLMMTYDLHLLATAIYTVVTLSVAIWYIIYNKGMITGKLTPEMLPDEWSAMQKQALIEELTRRRKKSKWALLILIPMITVFAFEILEIYFFPTIMQLLGVGAQ